MFSTIFLLRKLDIFFSLMFENHKENSWYLKFIKENIANLMQPVKLFISYVKFLESDQNKSMEEKTLLFNEFLGKFKNQEIIEMLSMTFISKDSSNFKYFHAKQFAKYINTNFRQSNLWCLIFLILF